MTPTISSLGLDHLPVEQRLALVQELWDSIAASEERLPLSEAKRQELDRRLADHEANPNEVIPWEQIEAAAVARFQK